MLSVRGTPKDDRISIGLKAGDPTVLQVDIGDDNSPDASFPTASVARIDVDAGPGNDFVRIAEDNGRVLIPVTLKGGPGNDELTGGSGAETIDGGPGEDVLAGGSGAGSFDGGPGNDVLVGGSGPGSFDGGPGDDTITGSAGVDALDGGPGNDVVDGGRGNDAASLGPGDDTFVWLPGEGSDSVEGNSGRDTMVFDGAGAAEQIDLSANGRRMEVLD